jgi:hypothetical protein
MPVVDLQFAITDSLSAPPLKRVFVVITFQEETQCRPRSVSAAVGSLRHTFHISGQPQDPAVYIRQGSQFIQSNISISILSTQIGTYDIYKKV